MALQNELSYGVAQWSISVTVTARSRVQNRSTHFGLVWNRLDALLEDSVGQDHRRGVVENLI